MSMYDLERGKEYVEFKRKAGYLMRTLENAVVVVTGASPVRSIASGGSILTTGP